LLGKGFKYEVLTWVGIVGGALTLFTTLSVTLEVARWAAVLVSRWKEWTHEFWLSALGWLGVHLPPEWTPALSFLLFWSLLAVNQAVKFISTSKLQTSEEKYRSKSFDFPSWRLFACVASMFILPFLFVVITPMTPLGELYRGEERVGQLGQIIVLVGFMICLVVPVLAFARLRLHAAVATCLMVIFLRIIIYKPNHSFIVVLTIEILFPILLVILLSIAPAKAVARRLIFLALGLLLLIALNELSKLGLDLSAPKLTG